MGEYLTTENLAIYAAIISTIGIIFTGLQYWLNVKDKKDVNMEKTLKSIFTGIYISAFFILGYL